MNRVDELKRLKALLDTGKATLNDKLDYYTLLETMINVNTECGKRMYVSCLQTIKETKEAISNSIEVNTDNSDIYMNFLAVDDAGLKRGDVIEVYYKDADENKIIKLKNVSFGMHHVSLSYLNKDKEFKMTLDYDCNGTLYEIDIKKVASFRIIDRSSRSKKVCLEGNKSIQVIRGLRS